MCLAVPMQILEIKDDGMARVTAMGAERDAALKEIYDSGILSETPVKLRML